eukprot:COSAG01_NODE_39008_length_482_cov_0.765013_1_plen_65_part_10
MGARKPLSAGQGHPAGRWISQQIANLASGRYAARAVSTQYDQAYELVLISQSESEVLPSLGPIIM